MGGRSTGNDTPGLPGTMIRGSHRVAAARAAASPVGTDGQYKERHDGQVAETAEDANVREILAYHEATKHSPESIRRIRWTMDWSNKPDPFKRYPGLPDIRLERPAATSGRAGLDAIAHVSAASAGTVLDRRSIARLLTWGAGLHHAVRYRDGETFFRTYASAGALYPVEVYLVCGGLEGLEEGIYHYLPDGDALVLFREGDHRPSLVRACAGEPAVAHAPAVLALTGIPWRTAWKYSERGYRHLFWDAGMIVANLLALAASGDLPARVVLGFVDRELELLLGLDGRREFPLCLVPLGTSDREVDAAQGPPEGIELQTPPLSRTEYAFEAILEANDAGRLDSPEEVGRWGGRIVAAGHTADRLDAAAVRDSIEDVIGRRGSARRFGPAPMPRLVLFDVLRRATRGVPSDHVPDGSHLIEPHLIVNKVEGLERGAYVWRDGELRLLRKGDVRGEAAFLCLDQRLGGASSATVFLMADLRATLERLGARGYRAAQLAAGIVAGRVYLAAYAHRFGATGLTFYDDEVERFFSPDAAGQTCLLVVAVGDSPRLLSTA
jgi:SagB-type dehydrogenase family enzyme